MGYRRPPTFTWYAPARTRSGVSTPPSGRREAGQAQAGAEGLAPGAGADLADGDAAGHSHQDGDAERPTELAHGAEGTRCLAMDGGATEFRTALASPGPATATRSRR